MIYINERDDSDEFFNSRKILEELIGNVVPPPNALNVESGDTPARDVVCMTFYILDAITIGALIGAKSLGSLHVYTHHMQYLDSPAGDIAANNLRCITLASKIQRCVDDVLPGSRQRPS